MKKTRINININHDTRGKSETRASLSEVQQTLPASHKSSCLTNLMSEVASKANLTAAFKAVKRNKGAPGIDNITVKQVNDNLESIIAEIASTLKDQTYRPMPVRGVKIPIMDPKN